MVSAAEGEHSPHLHQSSRRDSLGSPGTLTLSPLLLRTFPYWTKGGELVWAPGFARAEPPSFQKSKICAVQSFGRLTQSLADAQPEPGRMSRQRRLSRAKASSALLGQGLLTSRETTLPRLNLGKAFLSYPNRNQEPHSLQKTQPKTKSIATPSIQLRLPSSCKHRRSGLKIGRKDQV